MSFLRFPILIYLLFCIAGFSPCVAGASEEDPTLSLFSGGDQPLVSIGRTPRPTSQIAENVTVITSDQIALLNAHTLADVLNTVPGFQLEQVQTPGSFTFFSLQGASDAQAHVQVLIDGVPQNNLLQGAADVGLIPVQQIDRVEIIKGAASAAWGQALGGVINVITKMPESEKAIGGTAYASMGERLTTDMRGELSGTVKSFGYYLSGGNLHSDGLLPGNRINNNNVYGKFTYDLPNKGNLALGFDLRNAARGLDETLLYHDTTEAHRTYTFLTFTYPLAERLTLELAARASYRNDETLLGHFEQGTVVVDNNFTVRESRRGGSAKLVWGDSLNNLVAGVEYEHGKTEQWDALVPNSPFLTDRTMDRWGISANGAFSYGALTVLPGIRFDHTGLSSDALSYTLGATYRLTDKTVLRGYGAKGYSLPNAIWNNGPQKVWTVQVGAETEAVPYIWLKGTIFYNDTWNIEVGDFNLNSPGVTIREQIKQGAELEARTIPLYGFSLGGGYTFTDARDKETKERLQSVPEHGVKLALNYDNKPLGLRGVVTGNFVQWNAPTGNNAKDSAVIWDLHLTKMLFPGRELSPELFFSVHNLFNGSQYLSNSSTNAPRWLEGGVRWRF